MCRNVYIYEWHSFYVGFSNMECALYNIRKEEYEMDENKKIIDDQETEKVTGGAQKENPRLTAYYAVLDSLNGKTCKFCKKKYVKQAVIAEYRGYEYNVLKRFEGFGGKAVPCLYCDYWRNIEDFE